MKPTIRQINRFAAPILFLSPWVLDVSPDSSWTELSVAFGTGSYAEVSRDCEGNVVSTTHVPIQEGAVGIDHYTSNVHLGLQAGIIGETPSHDLFNIAPTISYQDGIWHPNPSGSRFYATPTVGLAYKYFGFDVGYLFPLHTDLLSSPGGIPAGSLRIGNKEGTHFRFRLAQDLPLSLGGPGIGSAGMGFNLGEPGQMMWLGLGAVPFDGLMFGSQVELPVATNVDLRFGASFGLSGFSEFGLNAGTKIRF
jgi:hypothetical protein